MLCKFVSQGYNCLLELRGCLENSVDAQGEHIAGRTRRQTSVVELLHRTLTATNLGLERLLK